MDGHRDVAHDFAGRGIDADQPSPACEPDRVVVDGHPLDVGELRALEPVPTLALPSLAST